MDTRTSRYAETYTRWQRDPEGIGGALRAKGTRAGSGQMIGSSMIMSLARIISIVLSALRARWRVIGTCWVDARVYSLQRRIPISPVREDYRQHGLGVVPLDVHYRHLPRSFWRDI